MDGTRIEPLRFDFDSAAQPRDEQPPTWGEQQAPAAFGAEPEAAPEPIVPDSWYAKPRAAEPEIEPAPRTSVEGWSVDLPQDPPSGQVPPAPATFIEGWGVQQPDAGDSTYMDGPFGPISPQLDPSATQMDQSLPRLDPSSTQLDQSLPQPDPSATQLDQSAAQLGGFDPNATYMDAGATHVQQPMPMEQPGLPPLGLAGSAVPGDPGMPPGGHGMGPGGPPMGPGGPPMDAGYSAYPPPPPPQGGGSKTSKPLIAAAAALVTVAVGAVGFVVWPDGDDKSAKTGPSTSPSANNTPVAKRETIPPPAQQQAIEVNKLLNASAETRRELIGALGAARACPGLPAAIRGFQGVGQRRQNQLRRTANLKLDKLPHGEPMRAYLRQAFTASLQVDRSLLVWAKRNQVKCKGKPRPDAAQAPGRAVAERRATLAKRKFTVVWNPVAKKTGQPQRVWNGW
ncbi:hypothetical protein [Spirillospora sp. CA-294931]|uniref:hypothetical protein n=1 Tax=Spirillospora sp. CA-294931 TaxID=3240042 RepID=UPI003D8F2991